METERLPTAETPPRAPRRVAHRRDLTYQFPVYRWLAWLVVFGYAVGLGLMYLVAGMFGLPAPLTWAFLVVMFFAGIALLERPKALLTSMMFFFLLMPSNRLLGLLGLPLPGFLDELFFVPFIAVIAMSWIQRQDLPKGMWFPCMFTGLAALSWYANGKPSVFSSIQVTLVVLKFFILWYFCRLVAPFRTLRDFWRWGEFYIYYAAAQFLYNILWQGRPWVTRHWDNSGGVFGPEGTGSAHLVGYISVVALFLLAAWWIGVGPKAGFRKRCRMAFMGIVIIYDLIFMTDTKHALLMMPVAFLPILFHRSIALKLRLALLFSGGLVAVVGFVYVFTFVGSYELERFMVMMMDSPKGDAYYAVTTDFPYLVRYPVLGAGPGQFFSAQAVEAATPLARRYIIPYEAEAHRAQVAHVSGTRTGGSLLAWPQCDVLTLMGEFGWAGTAIYVAFVLSILAGLWKKANRWRRYPGHSVVCLSLLACVLFLSETMFFSATATVPCLMFPVWMLIGRIWDLNPESETAREEAREESGGGEGGEVAYPVFGGAR